jgi:hypothetical protein
MFGAPSVVGSPWLLLYTIASAKSIQSWMARQTTEAPATFGRWRPQC